MDQVRTSYRSAQHYPSLFALLIFYPQKTYKPLFFNFSWPTLYVLPVQGQDSLPAPQATGGRGREVFWGIQVSVRDSLGSVQVAWYGDSLLLNYVLFTCITSRRPIEKVRRLISCAWQESVNRTNLVNITLFYNITKWELSHWNMTK